MRVRRRARSTRFAYETLFRSSILQCRNRPRPRSGTHAAFSSIRGTRCQRPSAYPRRQRPPLLIDPMTITASQIGTLSLSPPPWNSVPYHYHHLQICSYFRDFEKKTEGNGAQDCSPCNIGERHRIQEGKSTSFRYPITIIAPK